MTRRDWLLTAAVAGTAAISGYAYNLWRTSAAPDAASADAMLAATLPDLDGKPETLRQWRGKVLAINFWATWCAPCREEIPLFVKFQKKYGGQGLQFVGIAIDRPEKVRPYAAELQMNFPVLIGSMDSIELTRMFGNRAGVLPFTVIFGRTGAVAATEIGALKEARLEALLATLL